VLLKICSVKLHQITIMRDKNTHSPPLNTIHLYLNCGHPEVVDELLARVGRRRWNFFLTGLDALSNVLHSIVVVCIGDGVLGWHIRRRLREFRTR
jgi:hypothetical protein